MNHFHGKQTVKWLSNLTRIFYCIDKLVNLKQNLSEITLAL